MERWFLPEVFGMLAACRTAAVRFDGVDAVERFEFLPEVFFRRGAVADVRTVFVIQAPEISNETGFEILLP